MECFTEGGSIKTSIGLESEEVNRHTYISIKAQPFPECVCYLGSVNPCFVICKRRIRPTLQNCPEIIDFMCIHTCVCIHFEEGNDNSLQYCLENPWTEEPDGYIQSIGSQRVRHYWTSTLKRFYMCSIYCIGDLQ